METSFSVSTGRLWAYASDPDTSVHNSANIYSETGSFFRNTTNDKLFYCTLGGMSQTWVEVPFLATVQSLISAIPQSDWTQSNSASSDYIKNKPVTRSQSSSTRSLNTSFQVNSTRWSIVRYSVDISTTVSLSGSSVGSVFLETSASPTFASGVQILQEYTNGNSGTLVVGLVLTQIATACLSGDVPAGNYVRLRTSNVTGTPTFTYQTGQEVLV